MELIIVFSSTELDVYVHGVATSQESADEIKVNAYTKWISEVEELEGIELSNEKKLSIEESISFKTIVADQYNDLVLHLF